MNAPYAPAAIERDATNRAFRTLAQGLLVDVFAAVAVALTVALAGGIEWTENYWAALGLAVAKSVIVAVVSYVARRAVPPDSAPTTRGGAA